jgi:hypothetical protein
MSSTVECVGGSISYESEPVREWRLKHQATYGLEYASQKKKVLIFADNALAEQDNSAGRRSVILERKR